jgi:hypothetical protein
MSALLNRIEALERRSSLNVPRYVLNLMNRGETKDAARARALQADIEERGPVLSSQPLEYLDVVFIP